MGQALAGGVAFMRGQTNPVTPILEQQQRQQMGVLEIIQKMNAQKALDLNRQEQLALGRARLQETRNEHADKKLDGQMKMMQEMMDNKQTSPEGLAWAQQQFGALATKRWGTAPPPSIIQRTMNTEQQTAFAKDVWRAMPQDELGRLQFDPTRIPQLLKAHPLATPTDAQGYVDILNKPGAAKSYGLPDNDSLRQGAAEVTLKEAQALEALMPPGFQRTAANSAIMSAVAQELYPDVDLLKLTREQQRKITEQVALRAKENKTEELETRMGLQLQRGLAEISARGDMQMANAIAMAEWKAKNPTGKPPDWKQVSRELEPFVGLSGGVQKLQFLQRTLDAMPEQAFPADSAWGRSFAGRWTAKQYRDKMLGGDQDVIQFQSQVMNIMNGVVGRKWMDDKGVRVWASQKMEYETIDNLPPRKAIKSLLSNLEREMVTDMKNRLAAQESTGLAPEPLLKAARAAIGRVDPTAREAQPASPLAPPRLRRQFRDMRPGSKNYNKDVWFSFDVGDIPPPGLIEIK